MSLKKETINAVPSLCHRHFVNSPRMVPYTQVGHANEDMRQGVRKRTINSHDLGVENS